MAKVKYYAVKEGKEKGIFNTWEECQKSIKGYKGAVYKSFKSVSDAKEYLESKSSKRLSTQASLSLIEELEKSGYSIVYVDGSFKNNKVGWGAFFEEKEISISGNLGFQKERNVAGELSATIFALLKAIELGIKDLAIVFDYEGIEKFINGEWKTTDFTERYRLKFLDLAKHFNSIRFVSVDSHKGIYGNEMADTIAKLAID